MSAIPDRAPPGAEAAWGLPSRREPRWPATLAVLVAAALALALPNRLEVGPRWLVPGLEAVLALALLVASPERHPRESTAMRLVSILLIAIVNLANLVSLGLLVHALLAGTKAAGRELIYASVGIWMTNVIVFGLWYWELDRGGPAARASRRHREPDFLFPQMANPAAAPSEWSPSFVDYLYTSFTNATAFSPTDTMPLTPSAKLLFLVQSLASLLTVALVVSRAVNILA
jgi:uncharacterized membrane protein